MSERSAPRRALAVSAAVLAVSTLRATRPRPSSLEVACFDAINDLPDSLYAPVWPLMQFGALAAVPTTAAIVWIKGEREVATRLLVSGTLTWALAKGVKRIVRRARPAGLVPEVNIRGHAQSGDGFLSGHAGVASALAAGALPALPGGGPLLSAWAATVGLSRIYVGAHLPLDVVGGVALGVGVHATLRWLRPS